MIFMNWTRRKWDFMAAAVSTRASTSRRPCLRIGALPPGTPKWGKEFKKTLHQNFTRTMEIFCHGTSLPVESNSFSLDPDVKDAWGLPALRMTYRDHPDDLKLSEWMKDRAMEILDAAGAKTKWHAPIQEQQFRRAPPGHLPHGQRSENVGDQS